MRRKIAYEELESSDPINLTPLLDVLFVVLILFMLAAPLLQVDQVKLAPGSAQKEDFLGASSDGMKITVTKDNHILIQNKAIATTQLKPALKALKAQFPGLTPVIYHDQLATFGTYQTLKNALEEAGFHEMDVILKNQ